MNHQSVPVSTLFAIKRESKSKDNCMASSIVNIHKYSQLYAGMAVYIFFGTAPKTPKTNRDQ